MTRTVPKRFRSPARQGGAPRALRAQKSAARREAILAAALEEFATRGFAATRIDDVARRARVAKGTIYLHFRDKETLFQELIRSVLTPVVQMIERVLSSDASFALSAEQVIELFVREVYETRRKDVIRLIISEGPRFPKLAEFYYREVLSRVLKAARARLKRAAERGEIDAAVARFPQLLGAPGVVAIIWSGLFERFEPLDVRAMMRAYFGLLFDEQRAA
jgi:AcrR family transcriptional regulator